VLNQLSFFQMTIMNIKSPKKQQHIPKALSFSEVMSGINNLTVIESLE